MNLMGDIHVPTHNANFYNLTYKYGDYGGYKLDIITWDGKKTNLHDFMDSSAE